MAREQNKGRGRSSRSTRQTERARGTAEESSRGAARGETPYAGDAPRRGAPSVAGEGTGAGADTFYGRALSRRSSAGDVEGQGRLTSQSERGAAGPTGRPRDSGSVSQRGYGASGARGGREPRRGEYGAGGFAGGGYEQGGFVEPGGYREDVGYRGGASAEIGREGWTTPRQGYGLGREAAREYGGDVGMRRRWQREPVLAREIMTKEVRAVLSSAGLQEVARIMREENAGIVPVVNEKGKLRGLVTDRDIVMRTLPEGKNPLSVSVEEVMTDDVEAVTPDESLHDVVRLMGERQIRRVPVVDENDRLVGIISMADVATRADYDEDLQDALEEISSRRSFWSRIFG